MKHKSHFKPIPIIIVMSVTFIFLILIPPPITIAQPNLNIFGMEDRDRWAWDDGTTSQVYKLDPTSWYPREYMVISNPSGSETYGIKDGELQLWSGFSGNMPVAMAFDKGLTVAWYPLSVGEARTSSANVGNYVDSTITCNAKVIGYEEVSLAFDTFKTYKIRLTITARGPGGEGTSFADQWFVPYLGTVKSETAGNIVKLVSFAIGGGAITQETDTDGDNLKDYEELIKYGTDRLKADTDGDGCSDGREVFGGRNPNLNDPQGDINKDCAINLQDVILSLKLLVGMDTSGLLQTDFAISGVDVNSDGKLGLAEAIYIMQKVAEVR